MVTLPSVSADNPAGLGSPPAPSPPCLPAWPVSSAPRRASASSFKTASQARFGFIPLFNY